MLTDELILHKGSQITIICHTISAVGILQISCTRDGNREWKGQSKIPQIGEKQIEKAYAKALENDNDETDILELR